METKSNNPLTNPKEIIIVVSKPKPKPCCGKKRNQLKKK